MSAKINFRSINSAALAVLPSLLTRWLPSGRRKGREWVALNPKRADRRPGSFRMNMVTGRWSDFATGDVGGDTISLAAYLIRSQTNTSRASHRRHDGNFIAMNDITEAFVPLRDEEIAVAQTTARETLVTNGTQYIRFPTSLVFPLQVRLRGIVSQALLGSTEMPKDERLALNAGGM